MLLRRQIFRPSDGAHPKVVARERVVLAGIYFAGEANRRCSRWDMRVRQSEAGDLPQGSRLKPDWWLSYLGWDTGRLGDQEGPGRLLHTLLQEC